MASLEEIKLDREELDKLCKLCQRSRAKSLLVKEIAKIDAEIELKNKQVTASKSTASAQGAVASNICVTKIFNYAWDQSDKFVKLYITLNDVQKQEQDAVSTTFTQRSLDFQAMVENKVHSLKITSLASTIKPAESYHKVKQDMVILFLRKDQPKKWACVTSLEEKAKDAKVPKPKEDEDQDPSKSIMTLMKQMYDEGDDEMKKTIAKAWTEARDKNGTMDL